MLDVDSKVLGLTKHLTKLSTKVSILAIIIISILLGYLSDNSSLMLTEFTSPFYRLGTYFLIFGAMSIISGVLTKILIDYSKGNPIRLKHSMLLSLFSLIIIAGFSLLSSELYDPSSEYFMNYLLLGCYIAFTIRIMVIWGISNMHFLKSSIISAIQPILIIGAFLALTSSIINQPYSTIPIIIIKTLIAFVILMVAIYLFIKVIESPIKRNYGIKGLELFSLFISHFTYNSQEMEKLFEDFGENITSLIGILSFKGKNGIKALFLTPCIHPGPAGNLGGANMPTILANRFETFTMVSHGPCTHDFNPVSTKEIYKIEKVVKNALKDMDYSENTSEFIRLQHNNAIIGIQYFNQNLLILLTFAPSGADDIDFGIGFGLMNLAKSSCKVNNAIIVDCHNCFKEGAAEILPGNNEVQDIIKAIEGIETPKMHGKIRVGCAEDPLLRISKEDGIGDSGIKVMILETSYDNNRSQKVAYVLLDANNMVRGFREEIMENIPENIDHVEIMTSDTHSVNTLSNAHNPVGHAKNDEIIDSINLCLKEALDDLEAVSVAGKTCEIENIKTFGPTFTTGFMTTISSIVAVGRIFGVLILGLAFLIIFILILIPNT
ncbi:DUF2070 family protein [Methanobacterium alcaliphilum]|uniref:DUF2070 family protein n=1 Tax=Methanobacterium alcaliphilum TaxID=392018 RepID=UPI00200A3A8E|nr:DUF2070 family protein [Methanobacterium alcaliphilum]MCK9152375.1 DUF2070 family protein [Methanobacterium alcaliphilum]